MESTTAPAITANAPSTPVVYLSPSAAPKLRKLPNVGQLKRLPVHLTGPSEPSPRARRLVELARNETPCARDESSNHSRAILKRMEDAIRKRMEEPRYKFANNDVHKRNMCAMTTTLRWNTWRFPYGVFEMQKQCSQFAAPKVDVSCDEQSNACDALLQLAPQSF